MPVEWITPADLQGAGVEVVDVSTSTTLPRGHIPGAVWAHPHDLVGARELDDVVVVSEDGAVAAYAAAAATAHRGGRCRVLTGGTGAWLRRGGTLTTGGERWWSAPDDVYVRPYVGTAVEPAVMQAYLDWEHGLVEQLGRDGTHGFWVLGARP